MGCFFCFLRQRGAQWRAARSWPGGAVVPPPLRWCSGPGARARVGTSCCLAAAAGCGSLLQQRLEAGSRIRQLRAVAIVQAGQPHQCAGPEGGEACRVRVGSGRVEHETCAQKQGQMNRQQPAQPTARQSGYRHPCARPKPAAPHRRSGGRPAARRRPGWRGASRAAPGGRQHPPPAGRQASKAESEQACTWLAAEWRMSTIQLARQVPQQACCSRPSEASTSACGQQHPPA